MSDDVRQAADADGARPTRLGGAALALWAAAMLVVSGGLASAHGYVLPHPAAQKPELLRALAAHTSAADSGKFTVTHVLYAECRCSQRILDHLVTRRARSDVSERAVLVDAPPELAARLRAAGYRVEVTTPSELKAHYAIEAAPLLIVADPQQVVRYLGGYTRTRQALALHDLAIIDQVRRGAVADELPLLGCAVSRRLQRLLDPLGLVYRGERDD